MFDLRKIFDLRKFFAVLKNFLKSKIHCTTIQGCRKWLERVGNCPPSFWLTKSIEMAFCHQNCSDLL